LLSLEYVPKNLKYKDITQHNWKKPGNLSLDELSICVLSDAVDSIAYVWLKTWKKFRDWKARYN
jgi:hypothetical protein